MDMSEEGIKSDSETLCDYVQYIENYLFGS